MCDEEEENRRWGGKTYEGSGKVPGRGWLGMERLPPTDVHSPVGSFSDGCTGNLASSLPVPSVKCS